MSTDIHNHAAYLINGHGLAGRESRYWTRSIPKAHNTTKAKVVSFWEDVNTRWIEAKATPGSSVGKNAQSRALQVLIALPNSVTDAVTIRIINQLMKVVPSGHPVLAVPHYESGKACVQNHHLHMLFTTRHDGAGVMNDEFRLSALTSMRNVLHSELVRAGYMIHINNREHQVTVRPTASEMNWIRLIALKEAQQQETARDVLRSLYFLQMILLPLAISDRVRVWIEQEVRKAEHVKKHLPQYKNDF